MKPQCMRRSASALALVSIATLLSACVTSPPKVTARVDPALKPAVASVPDQSGAPQPLAALRSDAGPAGDFVEAVLRVWPKSPAQLRRTQQTRQLVDPLSFRHCQKTVLPDQPLDQEDTTGEDEQVLDRPPPAVR